MAHAGKNWPLALRRDLQLGVPTYRKAFPQRFRFGTEIDALGPGIVRYIYSSVLVVEDEVPEGIASWTGEDVTSEGKTVTPMLVTRNFLPAEQRVDLFIELYDGADLVLRLKLKPFDSTTYGNWVQEDLANNPTFIDSAFWGGTSQEVGGSAAAFVGW